MRERQANGKGAISLAIDGVRTGRTILPAVVQNDFAAYTLEFFAAGTVENPVVTVNRTNVNLSAPIDIDAGTWDVYVTAFMDEEKTRPAARGSLSDLVIYEGESISRSITLYAIIGEGEGVFRWKLEYPWNVIEASMAIIPLDEDSGTPEQTVYFTGADTLIGLEDSLTLNTGFYRVIIKLRNEASRNTERREILHVYQNMESFFEYTFTEGHFVLVTVTSGANSGTGSLRYAIDYAPDYATIVIDESVGTILLTSELYIGKNLTIIGNGTIITRDTLSVNNTRLVYIYSSYNVTFNRIWFKDGRRMNEYGAAIYNFGDTSFESCIFSGNRADGGHGGGAIYHSSGVLTAKGCTFFGNSATYYGGEIYVSSGILILEGNLFYGNTAVNGYPAVYRSGGTIISSGYNALDLSLGTGSDQSGWIPVAGDKTVNALPVSPVSFRLLWGSGAANVMSALPDGYPAFDFYGSAITVPAAAGAVQASAGGFGNVLEIKVNNSNRGSVSASPEPDIDGLVSGTVAITANPAEGYELGYWLVNGEKSGSVNPLSLPIADYTKVEAVFVKIFMVNNFSDESGSGDIPGTLRHALNNAIDGDTIRLSGVTPGQTSIALTSGIYVNRNITIEGNGVTLTPENISNWNSYILYIENSAAITISRIWFKDSRHGSYGGAVYNNYYGNLTLESCIFSSNWSGNGGGAIMNWSNGIITAKGCTFYGNTGGYGGAIYTDGRLDFVGNLFYGNSAINNHPVMCYGTRNSSGYNVVDVPIGTGSNQSGWEAADGDKTISKLPVSLANFKLLPGSGAANVITTLPAVYPAVDFYGNAITAPAAAGAVQVMAGDSGMYLFLSVNDSSRGSVNISPALNSEGFAFSPITLTASPAAGFEFRYWLVNGNRISNTNPLYLTLTEHTIAEAVFLKVFTVNNFSDASGSENVPGTLRHALANAIDGDTIRMSGVTPGQTNIALTSGLYVNRNITIEGNGVTLTPWNPSNWGSCILQIENGVAVTINRVWFRNSEWYYYGSAVYNNGNLTLESCIFSANWSGYGGGAIMNRSYGTITVKGCTFYGNRTNGPGGAIYNENTIILEGNLFYGNTANSSYPVMCYGNKTSNGYNVVDVPFGTGSYESGWEAQVTDKTINRIPVSSANLRLLPGSGAANVITSRPAGYPTIDFYGNAITAPAAAGAVQGTVSGAGYFVELKVNNSERGSISASPGPDANGFVSGTVAITAALNAGYDLGHWLVNGENKGSANPLNITLTDHSVIEAVFTKVFIVDDFSDINIVPGTLRHAIDNAIDGDTIRLSGVTPGETNIALHTSINVRRSVAIEGNGVIITRNADYNNNSQLRIEPGKTVTISRVWFKDNRANWDYGGAIFNNGGNVTLKSCIFSGNRTVHESSGYGGGAIYSQYNGTMTVKGCTFYGNRAYNGGAIYISSHNLILEGNLFYGNTAYSSYPVVYGNTTSNGYNVVDLPLGTSNNQSGWEAAPTDKTINKVPVSPISFRLVSGSGAVNVLSTLPVGYPTVDFYGNTISAPAAAGAVQSTASSGYVLDLKVNNSERGSVSVSPQPSSEALISGSVTVTAAIEAGYELGHWLVNGEKSGSANPLQLNVTDHTKVEAVLLKTFIVTNFSGASGSESIPGTIRHALNNVSDGDTIRLSGVTSGQSTIVLSEQLYVRRNITIEGNGITITRDPSSTNRLLYIESNATVTISRVWFKDGRTNWEYGAGIYNNGGTINLESCIFSGNRTGPEGYSYYGGAIYSQNNGTITVKGSTFYGNNAYHGGAISINGGNLILEGNLFYGNTADSSYPVVYPNGNITSNGYNVVDVPLGTNYSNQSGWEAAPTDTTFAVLPISGAPLNTATLAPVTVLGTVIPSAPAGFPATDFYGNARNFPGTPGAVAAFAATVTVTFNANGGTPAVAQQFLLGGNSAREPESMGKPGHIFIGWYRDSSFTTSWNFNETVSESITLYAKWAEFTDSLIDMVWIPAGTFMMGSPENEPGRSGNETQHEVTLTKGFHIGRYVVTQALYKAVMDGANPSYYSGDNLPVEQVNWYDAIVFCNKLSIMEGLTPAYRIDGETNPDVWIITHGAVPTDWDSASRWNYAEIVSGSTGYRLPTEAQWEYACRAGTTTAFNWGSDYITSDQANYNANSIDSNNLDAGIYVGMTSDVGSYAPNAYGLYDMHGNVWEWCWDWYGDYTSGAQTDPTGGFGGSYRVVRGGGWSLDGQVLRSALRFSYSPSSRINFFGFRLIRP